MTEYIPRIGGPKREIRATLERTIPSYTHMRSTKGERAASDALLVAACKADVREWIYFIRCSNRIKIGKARDLRKRLYGLQIGNPFELILIGLINGALVSETDLHMRFDSLRIRGEWFLDDEAIRSLIAEQGWRP